jgi:hypothetical protein
MVEWDSLPRKHSIGKPVAMNDNFQFSFVTKPNSQRLAIIKIARNNQAVEKLLLEIELLKLCKEWANRITGTWLLRCGKDGTVAKSSRILCKGITWDVDSSIVLQKYLTERYIKDQLRPLEFNAMLELVEQLLLGVQFLHTQGIRLRSFDAFNIELYGIQYNRIRFVNLEHATLQPESIHFSDPAKWAKQNADLPYKYTSQVSPAMAAYLNAGEENRVAADSDLLTKQDFFLLGSVLYFATTMSYPYAALFAQPQPINNATLTVIEKEYIGIAPTFYPQSNLVEMIVADLISPKFFMDLSFYMTLIQMRAQPLLSAKLWERAREPTLLSF